MKNILAGIIIAWLVPHIPADTIYLIISIVSGALLALVLSIVFTVLKRNRLLAADLIKAKQQLKFSEDRRKAAANPLRRRASLRK